MTETRRTLQRAPRHLLEAQTLHRRQHSALVIDQIDIGADELPGIALDAHCAPDLRPRTLHAMQGVDANR